MATEIPISFPQVEPIYLEDLTTAEVTGTGVFDVLMQAHKAHLDQQFKDNRIRGTEYATVYLGSLEAVLQGAITFLLQKDKTALEAALVAKQIELVEVEKEKALAELANIQALLPKVDAEIAYLVAQTEALQAKNPVEIEALQTEISLKEAQIPVMIKELDLKEAEIAIAQAQATKIPAEVLHTEAQTNMVSKQALSEIERAKVLIAEECKLRAEYDVLMQNKEKVAEEKQLLLWKTNTEKAQTLGAGVDPDSVIGKQKNLYQAQADGFKRDAEQKAAKVMVDSWNVRRTTDSTQTSGNANNKLDDTFVGQAVAKLLSGVGA